jgi:hypothetical protein
VRQLRDPLERRADVVRRERQHLEVLEPTEHPGRQVADPGVGEVQPGQLKQAAQRAHHAQVGRGIGEIERGHDVTASSVGEQRRIDRLIAQRQPGHLVGLDLGEQRPERRGGRRRDRLDYPVARGEVRVAGG